MESEACSEDRGLDICFYIGTLSTATYTDLSELERRFINDMYEHFKNCDRCRNYYIDAKRDAASNIIFSKLYTPESFRLLKENERVLDSLI